MVVGHHQGMAVDDYRSWHASRDTLMAHPMSNHTAVAYSDIFGEMVALSRELGFNLRIISCAN